MPAPIFYATVVPLAAYVIVKKGFVEPFLKEEKAKKVEKQKQENFNRLLERRREAVAAQNLMMATYSRIKEEETNKRGLIIIKAIYGIVNKDALGDAEMTNEVIDVTIPIQCLVKDSKLIIHEHLKVLK